MKFHIVMIKSIAALVIPTLLIIASCQRPPGGSALLEGKLSDASGVKLTLQEMDIKEIHSLDSVIMDEGGRFNFSVAVNETGFWLLKAPTGKILVLLLKAGDRVELTGSAADFPDHVTMNGPNEAMLLNDFFRNTRTNELKVDSLEMLLAIHQDSSDYYQLTQKLDDSFRQIWEAQRSCEIAFINKHPGSLASLVVLNYAFGMSPVLSPEEDFIYYEKVDSALSKVMPENKHVKYHHQRVEKERKAAAGK